MNSQHSDTYFIEMHFQLRQPATDSAPEATSAPAGEGQAANALSFTQANTPAAPLHTFAASEPTQQMIWQLPDTPRLRAMRGGRRRDWRSGVPAMTGTGFVCLLIAALMHWPYRARPVTPSILPITLTPATANASLVAAPQTAAARTFYAPQTTNSAVSYHRPARSVPGYGSVSSYAARGGQFAQVPPAAPTGSGASVFHYSY